MKRRKGSRILAAMLSVILCLSPGASAGIQKAVVHVQAAGLLPDVQEWDGFSQNKGSDLTFSIGAPGEDWTYCMSQSMTWDTGAAYRITINLDSTKARYICAGPENHTRDYYDEYKIPIEAADGQEVSNEFVIKDGASGSLFLWLGAWMQGHKDNTMMYEDEEAHTIKINSVTLEKLSGGSGGSGGSGDVGGGDDPVDPSGEYGENLSAPYDFAGEREAYNQEYQSEGLDFDTENAVVNGDLAAGLEGWGVNGPAPAVSGYKMRWKDIVVGDEADWSRSVNQAVGSRDGSYQVKMKVETSMARKILVGDVDGTKQIVSLEQGINDVSVDFKSWTAGKPLWICVAGKVQGENGERLVEEADKNRSHTVNVWGISMVTIPERDVPNEDGDGDMEYVPSEVNVAADKTSAVISFPGVPQAVSYKVYQRTQANGETTDTLVTELMADEGKSWYSYEVTGLSSDTKYTFVLETCFPEDVVLTEGSNKVVRTVTTESSGSSGGGTTIMGYPYSSVADSSNDNSQSESFQLSQETLDTITFSCPSAVKAKTANKKAIAVLSAELQEIMGQNGITCTITYKSSNNKVLRANSKTGRLRAKKTGQVTVKATITFSNNQKKVLKKAIKIKQ